MESLRDQVLRREGGLKRALSVRQMVMISIGGAIGTGLFLGSTLAISLSGPSVIVSYAVGALVALIVAWALLEMSSAIPTAGSFGVYAEQFLGHWAGFNVRWLYWLAQVVAIGGEATAAAIYAQFWFPGTPLWIFVVGFSAALVVVNAFTVKVFGTFEYWFAMIKVAAIVAFILLGAAAVFWGFGRPAPGLANWTSHGGFFPNGIAGTWLAMIVVIFSYYGVEVAAVTSGEAHAPERSLRRVSFSIVVRLTLFYVLGIAIVVAVVPWTEAGKHTGIFASPFVLVFQQAHIPYAAGVMNFVVLTAALSSMNTDIYLTTRMLFSLARSGYAPSLLGRVSGRGVPVWALAASTGGMVIAIVLSAVAASSAYFTLFGIAIFGAIVVWVLILLTHIRFRRRSAQLGLTPSGARMPLFPIPNIVGALALVAILFTAFPTGLPVVFEAGIPTLVILSLIYLVARRRRSGAPPAPAAPAATD
jgi:AAT family amino acid transporter